MSISGETLVVIPARRASTRLPEKLLLAESGKPLLAHTLERCLEASLPNRVIAAVDCEELAAIAREAGAETILTDPSLASGSDRVGAAVAHFPEAVAVVNVQGDEPEIEAEAVDAVLQAVLDGAAVATLAAPLPDGALENPAAVKVRSDELGNALGFTRLPDTRADWRLHVGVYGYSTAALESFTSTPPTPSEQEHHLEQLRFLENGIPVQVIPWPRAFLGIDTRSDYDAFLARRVGASPP